MSDASAVLAEVVRSGFVEGVHRGSLVVVDADGSVLLERGDVRSPVFPRSCNKLMQATGLVELGYAGTEQHLAIAAASHWGQPRHVTVVREVLAAAGLDEGALRTPADWPVAPADRDALVLAGGGPSPVLMNCSGKHAAMLATCLLQGWPLDDYRAPDHPLQRHLVATIERMSGERSAWTGVDGCGAPVSAISLSSLARAYSGAVQADPSTPERRVADAMRAHPRSVCGEGSDVTAFMLGVPGLLVKDGAEGVYAAALPDGRALALKVDDGAERARPVVTAAVLRWLGVDEPVLDQLGEVVLRGGGVPVGAVRAAAGLVGQ